MMKKTNNPKIREKEPNNPNKKKKNHILLTFVCIFVAVIILVGGILGIFAYVKKMNSVVSYGSYMLSEGEACYFASYYKYRFLVGLSDMGIEGYDTEAFWQRESSEGVTYGELLEKSYREYLSGILVANALFDKYSDLDKTDKENIEALAEASLKNHGGEKSFNEKSARYGFDYDDYKSAVEYLYKAAAAQSEIFGKNGEKLSAFPDECADYYDKKYSRVSLMFLRDEEMLDTDENGKEILRPITEEEKKEREAIVSALRTAIENRKNGAEGRITPEMFEYYYEKSDSDMEMYRSYYFKDGSEATDEFASVFPEAVSASLSMQVGEFSEVDCSIGTCFIYKEELNASAFTDSENPFFSDFYSGAVKEIYSDMLALYASDVSFSERMDRVDIISLPKNYEFTVGITLPD